MINDEIRARLFPTNEKYIKGDLLIFDDNYDLEGGEMISNGYEFQVLKSRQTKKYDYVVWEIDFLYDGFSESIYVLHPREITRFKKECQEAFLAAKMKPFGAERELLLQRAWEFKRTFAPVEYGYCVTSHKSQGSTYNTVVVHQNDIMNVKPTSNKVKSLSMYTAITRAAKTCIIIDGNVSNGQSLQQAINYSMENL